MIVFVFNTYMTENKKQENFVDLYLSNRFIQILSKMNKDNRICNKFLGIIKNMRSGLCDGKFDVSFIDSTDKNDTISYITSNKAKPILDKYISVNRIEEGINLCWISNRQEQRLSRFITRIFGSEFTLKEIEDFVENYKVVLAVEDTIGKFELVKGEDVKNYYYGRMYNGESNGQLQRSCMKSLECNDFFGIYIKNPDKMNMLILKDNNGKIYGRANVWFLDEPMGRVFMDRIYTTYDWQIKLFIDYAIKNNWLYKSKQIYGGSVIPLIDGGKSKKIIMSVNLEPHKYKYYPYVDTLQFYNPSTGVLTSDVSKFGDSKFFTLVLANGSYYQDDGTTYKIDYLGRIVHQHFVIWSNYDNVFVHRNDAIPLNYRNDYVTPEHEFINIKDNIYLKDDVEKDPETNEYIIKKIF